MYTTCKYILMFPYKKLDWIYFSKLYLFDFFVAVYLVWIWKRPCKPTGLAEIYLIDNRSTYLLSIGLYILSHHGEGFYLGHT